MGRVVLARSPSLFVGARYIVPFLGSVAQPLLAVRFYTTLNSTPRYISSARSRYTRTSHHAQTRGILPRPDRPSAQRQRLGPLGRLPLTFLQISGTATFGHVARLLSSTDASFLERNPAPRDRLFQGMDRRQERASREATFWNEFFDVFGIRRRVVASFEEPVKRISGDYGYIDLFWPGIVLVEHKSLGLPGLTPINFANYQR